MCEIFPPDSEGSDYGKGIRAPGSWNPSTNTLSEIVWHNTAPLLSRISQKSQEAKSLAVNAELPNHFPDIERNNSFLSPSSFLHHLLKQFTIAKASTRNQQLMALTGQVFHQISYGNAKQMARLQFEQKTASTMATIETHLASFDKAWSGLDRLWRQSLSPAERAQLSQLQTDHERDAFRIIRSFARKAREDGALDFPIGRENLAARLGTTGIGAAWIRDKFVKLQIIQKTANYVPNKKATRFKWSL